jgi:hypothetical protein
MLHSHLPARNGGGSGPVARAVFKTVVGGDEPPRWVRLPCALALSPVDIAAILNYSACISDTHSTGTLRAVFQP